MMTDAEMDEFRDQLIEGASRLRAAKADLLIRISEIDAHLERVDKALTQLDETKVLHSALAKLPWFRWDTAPAAGEEERDG